MLLRGWESEDEGSRVADDDGVFDVLLERLCA